MVRIVKANMRSWHLFLVLLVLGMSGAMAHGGEVKPLKVTIGGNASLGIKPVSADVSEELTVDVEGAPETPEDVPGAGPTYAWSLVEAKYRPSANAQWQDVQAAQGAVTLTPEGGPRLAMKATLENLFVQPGFYHFKVTVTVDWNIGTGEVTWFGEDHIELDQTVVGVEKLQYRIGNGEYSDVPDPLVVPLGQSVNFKAITKPPGVGWPAGKPGWSSTGTGVTGAEGTGEIKGVGFTQTGNKTVSVECGDAVTVNIKVTSVAVSFTGLPRACAGGVDNDAHIFTLPFNAKNGTQNLANAELEFTFGNNQSHDPNKKARFRTAENTWAETATITTDANGNASVTVLSSDLVSSNIKISIQSDGEEVEGIKLNGNTVQGGVPCDFAVMKSIRRFGMVDFPEDEDKGWKYINGVLTQPNEITTLKIYLKYQINPNLPIDTTYFNPDGTLRTQLNDDGNWKIVNGHTVRISIFQVLPQDGEETSGAASNYSTLIDANDQPVTFIDVVTADDGSAQVRLKAGSQVSRALEVVLDADDISQW